MRIFMQKISIFLTTNKARKTLYDRKNIREGNKPRKDTKKTLNEHRSALYNANAKM